MSKEKTAHAVRMMVSAVDANNRINACKKEVENLEKDINNLDGIAKLIMMDSAMKQIRVDSLKKELENAVEQDLQKLEEELLNY